VHHNRHSAHRGSTAAALLEYARLKIAGAVCARIYDRPVEGIAEWQEIIAGQLYVAAAAEVLGFDREALWRETWQRTRAILVYNYDAVRDMSEAIHCSFTGWLRGCQLDAQLAKIQQVPVDFVLDDRFGILVKGFPILRRTAKASTPDAALGDGSHHGARMVRQVELSDWRGVQDHNALKSFLLDDYPHPPDIIERLRLQHAPHLDRDDFCQLLRENAQHNFALIGAAGGGHNWRIAVRKLISEFDVVIAMWEVHIGGTTIKGRKYVEYGAFALKDKLVPGRLQTFAVIPVTDEEFAAKMRAHFAGRDKDVRKEIAVCAARAELVRQGILRPTHTFYQGRKSYTLADNGDHEGGNQ
jgi:hypothetical protein